MKRRRTLIYEMSLSVLSHMKIRFGIWAIIGASGLLPLLGQADNATFAISMSMHEPFYTPMRAIVKANQSIQWINQSHELHTITHDGCRRGSRCAFESGPVPPGRSFRLTALPSGRYSYHCSIHPFMQGEIVVQERKRQQDLPVDL